MFFVIVRLGFLLVSSSEGGPRQGQLWVDSSHCGGSVRQTTIVYAGLRLVNVKLPKIVTKLQLVFVGAHSALLDILNVQVGYP